MLNQSLLLAAQDGYQISRSVRLRSSASAFFSRTNSASPTDSRRWTWSGWVKRGTLGAVQTLIGQCNAAADDTYLQFRADNSLGFGSFSGAGTDYGIITPAVFRDPSAWYHVIAVLDTANATAADRAILYVNGVRQTVNNAPNGTWPQNSTNNKINTASQVVNIGRRPNFGDTPFDGYLTEINFIDGQALTPAAFGETNPITGVWQPRRYTGTYGTNGFYLNFADNSAATATAIGKDSSGQGNNWTPNNVSLTAGATYDSMLDVPTPWADGGNGRGNYCVLNPLQSRSAPSRANLEFTQPNAGHGPTVGTIGMTAGKWYWEVDVTTFNSASSSIHIGIVGDNYPFASGNYIGNTATSYAYRHSGQKYNNAASSAYGGVYGAGNTIGIALDLDAGTLTFYLNNVSQGTAYSGLSGTFYPAISLEQSGSTSTVQVNFGQRPFAYTPPTGFRALNTQNLPDSTIPNGRRWFDVTTYTGNGTSQSITNAGSFQPDLVWIKSRSFAASSQVFDAVRGVGGNKELTTDQTYAEGGGNSASFGFVSSLNANGFTLGAGSTNSVQNNQNGSTYVAWQWKEGAQAGFDIVTFNSGAAGSITVAHSLGVAPRMIIVKDRTNSPTNWSVYHASVISNVNSYLQLNGTAAIQTAANIWGTTLPTSTLFGFNSGVSVVPNANCVAYLFAEVPGFSRFGSYTGNGSTDGPFVFCGFRPRWVMIKATSTAGGGWVMHDTERSQRNLTDQRLAANTSGAEFGNDGFGIDITSSGFKVRTSDGNWNGSSVSYIFAAFAENPFKYSLAR